MTKAMFPSPRGDKLQFGKIQRFGGFSRFRPLAGINCNAIYYGDGEWLTWFPSPRGDKLQLALAVTRARDLGFPSPRGDKLQFVGDLVCEPVKAVSVPSRG